MSWLLGNGGHEAMAEAYGKWATEGRAKEHGVFYRIWDFLQRLWTWGLA